MKKRYLLLLPLLWFLVPPGNLFDCDYSRAVLDRNGTLIRVWLTEDEQFRFPPSEHELPEKYVTSLLNFEDRRFRFHPGVDPLSIGKAFLLNAKAGKIERGGSTITMQLARLVRPKNRTYAAKISELFYALKYELFLSKNEILRQYASHVPMGGNIVGLEAASYRYFGKQPIDLTWAESALLAVLPNAPGMIDLTRERKALLEKRNRLLESMSKRGVISREEYLLSSDEPLPEKVSQIPFKAPHFTRFVGKESEKTIVESTLDMNVQEKVESEVERYRFQLHGKGIANCAVLVADHRSGEVLAYAGSQDFYDRVRNGEVDGVQAKRSPGSLLKPLLTAAVLDQGPFTRSSMIQDIPTFYGTFSPQNASLQYDGVVELDQALIRSLNVPFVRLLNYYGVEQFHYLLKQGGIALDKPAGHYGLSMILGGAEASLWELSRFYLALAGDGSKRELFTEKNDTLSSTKSLFSAGAVSVTRDIMTNLVRPGFEQYRSNFAAETGEIAWKTGTSYGQKDGWALGFSGSYLVGVWVGNFTGEGNSEIGGAQSAGPLLFSIFNSLHDTIPFPEKEYRSLQEIEVCAQSGFGAGAFCDSNHFTLVPLNRMIEKSCPYHKEIEIDQVTGARLCSGCWNNASRTKDTLFVLPPATRDLYSRRGYDIDSLPHHYENCTASKTGNSIRLLYPSHGIKIFLPRNFDGTREKLLFSAAHRNSSAELFWYLNNRFIGTTSGENVIAVDSLSIGKHRLFVQDGEGSRAEVSFDVFWKE